MQKTEIQINTKDFPDRIQYIFENARVYDSSSHPSNTVLYSDSGYYIKTAERGSLAEEAERARLFEMHGIGADVVSYISEDKDFLVTREARGEDCTHYLDDPERLCGVLAEAMRFLHSRPVDCVPVSPCMELYLKSPQSSLFRQDVFIHGDFCLPNVILDNWKLSAFIDFGLSGAGDRHIDIYWALWSLAYNLKTDKYTDCFLELYGKENYDRDILKIVSEIESQA